MEKESRTEGSEFWVPDVLIQRIQSFMSVKEAIQTCILSKSWYNAYSTRPNLILDYREFENYGIEGDEMFLEFASNIIQRYETMNIKIESFKLWMSYALEPSNYTLVYELIVKATKLGALHFHFQVSDDFTVPREVFESENLIKLSVIGCNIDLSAYRKISCWRLKSLYLEWVRVKGDLIRDLISMCPLIEDVTLSSVTDRHSDQDLSYEQDWFYVYRFSSSYEFCKLRSLFLGYVDLDALFFSNLSSNFPCLKDLTLQLCTGYKSIQISSRSLECISFMNCSTLRAEFDVPSIRKFKYRSLILTSLFFRTTSMEWESDISVQCRSSCIFRTTSMEWESDISVECCSSCTGWFLRLKKLLTCLNLSKIYLTITVSSIEECVWPIEEKNVDFRGLPETAVENLTIYAPPTVWLTVLECLFRSCCPKSITLHLHSRGELGTKVEVKNDFLEIVSERNVEGVREYLLMMKMNHELLEVDVQFFEESLVERHPLPQKIHFQLRWRA